MVNDMDIGVTKVVLNIKGQAVELTPDEARKLKSEMEALLGSSPRFIPVPVIQEIVTFPSLFQTGQHTLPRIPEGPWCGAIDGFGSAPAPTYTN